MSLYVNNEVFLIATTAPYIISSKLPHKREVLKVHVFNMRKMKLNFEESARIAVQETTALWEKARISTQAVKNCIPKMKELNKHWEKVGETYENTFVQRGKKMTFSDVLDCSTLLTRMLSIS